MIVWRAILFGKEKPASYLLAGLQVYVDLPPADALNFGRIVPEYAE